MSAPLRLGVIGCGTIAQAHAIAIRFNADDGLVRCVAAADPDPTGIERFVSIAGDVEHRGANGHDVIENPDVDAVVLITPTRFHREYVLATCAAGKPLFTEKPLAPTFAVVRESARRGSRVGHHRTGRIPVSFPSDRALRPRPRAVGRARRANGLHAARRPVLAHR